MSSKSSSEEASAAGALSDDARTNVIALLTASSILFAGPKPYSVGGFFVMPHTEPHTELQVNLIRLGNAECALHLQVDRDELDGTRGHDEI